MCARAARRPTRLLRSHSLALPPLFDEPLFRVTIGHESSPPVKRHRGEPGHTRDASGTGTFQSRLMEVPHQCPIFRLIVRDGTRYSTAARIVTPTGAPRANARAVKKRPARKRGGGARLDEGSGPRQHKPKKRRQEEDRRVNQRWRARGARYAVQSRPGPAPGPAMPGPPPKGCPRRLSPPLSPDPAPFQGGSTGNVCEMCLCERLPRRPFRGLWVCVWP